MNPLTNFNQQLKNNFQSVINNLGPDFHKYTSDEDTNTGEVMVWQAFGFEGAGWYHVSIMDKVGGHWVCIGCGVIDRNEIDWTKVRP